MNKLQNNFTTLDQSKLLLQLGVPADSADCFYDHYRNLEVRTYSKLESTFFEKYTRFTPCWSVGRLIEIMKICNHPDDVDEVFCELAYSKKNLVELIVRLMEENKEITDFSKLEE